MKSKNNQKRLKKVDPFEIMDAVSMTECTGLISRAAHGHDEWIQYNEVVQFAPPGSGNE